MGFSSENQLYLLKIDFSVVRLSRLFAMISLLLSFVSSVLLLFLAENIFLVSPSILRIRNRFASKKTPLKKSRIFLRSKREKTRKKTLVTQKTTQTNPTKPLKTGGCIVCIPLYPRCCADATKIYLAIFLHHCVCVRACA